MKRMSIILQDWDCDPAPETIIIEEFPAIPLANASAFLRRGGVTRTPNPGTETIKRGMTRWQPTLSPAENLKR